MTLLRLLAVLDVLSGAPPRAKRLAPRPDGLITLFVSSREEKSGPARPIGQGVAVARLIRLAIVLCLGATAAFGQAGNTTLIRELEQPPDVAFVQTKQIPCKARKFKPRLDLEFRLHTGYWVELPFKELIGPQTVWRMQLVVEPISPESAEPVTIEQFIETGAVPQTVKGTVEMSGSFAVGEGSYRATWHLTERFGRYCSVAWNVEAKRGRRDRDVPLALEPGEIRPARSYLFRQEEPVDRSLAGGDLNLKVFLNLDTGSRRRATVRPWLIAPMVAVMRNLFRRPEFGEFALVAYSQEDQKVLYRSDYAEDFNFQAMGSAVRRLAPATVDFRDLARDSETNFIEKLLSDELRNDDRTDAIVFIGYEHREGKKIPKDRVMKLDPPRAPVFYFNFAWHPWNTTLGNAVKTWGGSQFRIRSPRELLQAVEKVVGDTMVARRNTAGL